MKRNNENYILDQKTMDIIASYMDDEKRENLHSNLAPCEPEFFLKEYVKIDPDFEKLLLNEFDITL